MIIIGFTGKMGTGKSTAAAYFKNHKGATTVKFAQNQIYHSFFEIFDYNQV